METIEGPIAATPSELGNYKIADTYRAGKPLDQPFDGFYVMES
jgi:hypothetical protein